MAGGGELTGGGPRFTDPVEPPPEGTPWTVLRLLRWSTRYLAEKEVPEARLDAEYLLANGLGMDRLQLYLHFDRPVEPSELERFRPLLVERARRRPLQYILGRTGFRELELRADERGLIPRPETEELVGAVLDRVDPTRPGGWWALDIGTGSGAIALALASEGPFDGIVATDISASALELARENAVETGLDAVVEFREGAGFLPVKNGERFDVVVSNPPYVTGAEFARLAPEVREWEPHDALVAEPNGLGVIRDLVAGAGSVLSPGGLLAIEFGAGQAREVAELIRTAEGFGEPEILRDLSRRERMVMVRWGVNGSNRERSRPGPSGETAAREPRGDTASIPTKVRSDVQD